MAHSGSNTDPVNMPQCPRTGTESARCIQHMADSGLVLAHYGMFTNEISIMKHSPEIRPTEFWSGGH